MARKGGFLKGIVASAATYAVKTAVDIAANPENMQKVAQLVSEQQVGSKLKQAAASMHLPAVLSPSARVAKQLDAIEETLEQYADQFPVNAPVERWKSTLQSLHLMDTMNRSTTGSEHKIRLEKLQTQTEALFNEIFQALDSGDDRRLTTSPLLSYLFPATPKRIDASAGRILLPSGFEGKNHDRRRFQRTHPIRRRRR